MRISDPLALAAGMVMLSACSGAADPKLPGRPVDCRVGGMPDFARDCTMEEDGFDGFILHHPDGGFRRFRLSRGDMSTATTDGAEKVVLTRDQDGAWRITVGGDVYRLGEERVK
ncbi:MAG: hypothetical protein AB7U35_00180 [Sphingobium sp.]